MATLQMLDIPAFHWTALERIEAVRFEGPAHREFLRVVEPLLAEEVVSVATVGQDRHIRLATDAEIAGYRRDPLKSPVVYRRAVVRDGEPVLLRGWPGGALGQELGWYADWARRALTRIDAMDAAAAEAEFSARRRAEHKAERVGKARAAVRGARQVLDAYRRNPYWQQAADLAERVAGAERELAEARAELAAAEAP
jgi:hypothetical protein